MKLLKLSIHSFIHIGKVTLFSKNALSYYSNCLQKAQNSNTLKIDFFYIIKFIPNVLVVVLLKNILF